MTPSQWLKLFRDAVAVTILYVGWLGIMVFIFPSISYLKLRQSGASRWQAGFLSAVVCLLTSWLVLLVCNRGNTI
jgi:hypothetical protein